MYKLLGSYVMGIDGVGVLIFALYGYFCSLWLFLAGVDVDDVGVMGCTL